MHDTDNDGIITLEEYRHVSLYSVIKCCFRCILSCFTVNKCTFSHT